MMTEEQMKFIDRKIDEVANLCFHRGTVAGMEMTLGILKNMKAPDTILAQIRQIGEEAIKQHEQGVTAEQQAWTGTEAHA